MVVGPPFTYYIDMFKIEIILIKTLIYWSYQIVSGPEKEEEKLLPTEHREVGSLA